VKTQFLKIVTTINNEHLTHPDKYQFNATCGYVIIFSIVS